MPKDRNTSTTMCTHLSQLTVWVSEHVHWALHKQWNHQRKTEMIFMAVPLVPLPINSHMCHPLSQPGPPDLPALAECSVGLTERPSHLTAQGSEPGGPGSPLLHLWSEFSGLCQSPREQWEEKELAPGFRQREDCSGTLQRHGPSTRRLQETQRLLSPSPAPLHVCWSHVTRSGRWDTGKK